jgi:class 3 adenylate cyclase/tetratricopeptide (TPR) repeat protein
MRRGNKDKIFKTVSTYFPDFLLNRVRSGKPLNPAKVISLSGGLLQADASGFTQMSDKLSPLGPKGAEELTEIFNGFFFSMLKVIFAHGGDVLKFGGDSLLVLFEGKGGAKKAIRAALAMQEEMKSFRSIPTSGGNFFLALHVGINTGKFWALSLGEPTRKLELTVLGENINSTIRCNEAAQAGEIRLTKECWRQLKDQIQIEKDDPQFFRLEGLKKKLTSGIKSAGALRTYGNPEKVLKSLLPYLPRGIYEKIEAEPARTSLDSEHRKITIIFLNLLYTCKLLTDVALNKKDARLALNRCFETVQQVVADHGGAITRIDPYNVGDKVLILFGAPVAQEDDEQRAIVCALRINEKLMRLNANSPYPIEPRIGINTGDAFCGEVGSAERKEYTVMGKDVNLAARLMSKADPGEIMVGSQTFQAVSSNFVATRVKLEAKGISDPVIAFKVKELSKSQPTAGGSEHRQTEKMPIVGREREIRQVDQLIKKVIRGEGQLLSIVGEAGIGKSRLTEKILELCADHRVKGILVDCQYYGANTPLLPWTDAVKSYLGIKEADDPAAKAQKLTRSLENIDSDRWAPLFNDMLGLSVPENEWTKFLDGKTRKERLFDTILKLTLRRSSNSPDYLIFEDIHWIDLTSLELLLMLSQKVPQQPLFVVLVHRPELSLGDFEQAKNYHQIRLKELEKEDALNLASVHLESAALPEQMERLVWEKSRGNPLYLQELIHSLRDSGHIAWNPESGRYEMRCQPEQIKIPDTVQDVIMARIDKLDEMGRKVIKTASVIGRVFSFDTLSTVLSSSTSQSKLKYWLEYLDKLDLVPLKETQPSLEYMFKHALTQEVAYNLLPFAQKRKLHLKIGNHYEKKFKDSLEERCELLAHHYENSDNLNKAFLYLIKAGKKGKRGYANQEAIRFLDRAEMIYRQDSTQGRLKRQIKSATALMLELSEERGQVYKLIGEYDKAEKNFSTMLDLSMKGPNQSLQVRALNLLAELHWLRGDYSSSQSCAYKAHKISLLCNDEVGLAWSYNNHGDISRRQGGFEEALECYRSSLNCYKRINDDEGIANTYNNMGICYWSMGSLTHAAEHLKRALRSREEAGDKLGEAKTRNNLALIYQDRGELLESLKMLTSALEIFKKLGDKRNSGYCLGNLGTIYKSRAEFSQAVKAFQDSIQIFSEIGDQHALTYSIGNIGDVQLKMGNLQEAKTCYDATLSSAGELGDEELESETLSRFGEFHFLSGDAEKSEKYFQKALELAKKIKSHEFTMKALAGLAELALVAGQTQKAKEDSDTLLAMAEQENTREYLATSYLLRGKAKSVLAQPHQAQIDLQEALKIAEEVGFTEISYKTHLELGGLHRSLSHIEGEGHLIRAKRHFDLAKTALNRMTDQIEEPNQREIFLKSHLALDYQTKEKFPEVKE